MLLSDKDIIIVGQQAWDTEIGSNCKNIAYELSKHNRVLYVNPPLDRITRIGSRHLPAVQRRLDVIAGKVEALVPIAENLWNLYPDKLIESINWIGPEWIFDRCNFRNNRIFASTIRRAMEKLGFKADVLFNDNDIFRSFYLKDLLAPKISVYYVRDYMIATDYWRKHGRHWEPKLIEKSDLCVANSVFLTNYCKQFNPNAVYIGQGCELELFDHQLDIDVPPDVVDIRKPVVGYVGALSSARLDRDLLRSLAGRRPDWSFVLVGPEDDGFLGDELHQLTNVHFLGSKPVEQLPDYINAFDVCINPQLINELTIGNYPRKIDEYLAMGKPVVATKNETMEIFADHVFLAERAEQFCDFLEEAMRTNTIDKCNSRRQFAYSHTWEASVATMSTHVNDFWAMREKRMR